MAPKRSASIKEPQKQKRVNQQLKTTSSKPASKKTEASAVSNVVKEGKEGPALIIKDAQWDGIHKKARRAMGDKPAIHGEVNNVNRIDDVLRVFDLTFKYGPATGMTRLDRWNRAEELGLDPPVEVKNLLLTREGLNDVRYCDSYATNAGV